MINCIYKFIQTSVCIIHKNGNIHKANENYLFNDDNFVNIKAFDSSQLKIYKLSFKAVFSFNVYYIKCIPTKTLDHVDDDKDYLYLFLDDINEYIEENDGTKYLIFNPTSKKQQRSIKKLQKTFGRN